MPLDRFADCMREGLLSLPQDLKAILRVIEDPDLDDDSRVLACGAVLHVLSGQNAIPGVKGILGYVDDVLVLRLVLERIEKVSPDVLREHREDSPEVFEPMQGQMEATRAFLGDLVNKLDRTVDQLPKIAFEGHSARECARNEEGTTWLYDSVMEAITERLELNEDDVARAVKGASDILTHLKLRA